MLSSRTSRWVAGTALLCAVLLALTWLLLLTPKRAQAAELRDQNTSTQAQNDLLEVKIARLRAQFGDLAEQQAELASILAQIPPDAGVSRLVRDLDAMSKTSGVTLLSVTPGGATTVAAPASPGPATASTGAAGTAGTAADDTLYEIPVAVAVSGDYFQAVAFLKQLQTRMPRAFLVTAVQMAADGSAASAGTATTGQVAVTVTGKVFALPGMSADVLTTATGGGSGGKSPISAGTPTGAPTGAPTGTPTRVVS